MELGKLIKSRREELRLTQKDLADKVGVSGPTIARYESGEIKDIRRDKIKKLADALEIPVSELMGWNSSKVKKSVTDPFGTVKELLDTLVKVKGYRSFDDIDAETMFKIMELSRKASRVYLESLLSEEAPL